MRTIFTAIIIIATLTGCKTKQITITKTNVIRDTVIQKEYIKDTVFKTKTITITEPVSNSVEIENPCDSITNKLNDFNQSLSSGGTSISVVAKDGKLTIKASIDSIRQEAVDEYKASIKHTVDKSSKNSSKELIIDTRVVKKRIPWWILLYSLAITVYAFRKQIWAIVTKIYPPLKILR